MEKLINQTHIMGLLVIFRSLFTKLLQSKHFLSINSVNKERNITSKDLVSVWFNYFSTYFNRFFKFTKIFHFPYI